MSRDVSDSQEQGAGGTEQSDKAKVMTDFQGLIGGGH